ncbi:hypothetical protein B7O87_14585 [Cylindrospermopsis raciborskii CENA303]|uniref:Transposase n=1 Tax=Cylindrospermopsis raciborskii CENA303 TaxID=1170769 RepID=A0A1X4G355_9CYAN|nr:hypothetical protein B7O87_14585 [Cylindrospermopsis raciborskii CENA303]
MNADCQGAANIIKKVSTIFGLVLDGVSKASLTAPIRVRLWQASSKKSLSQQDPNESPSL